MERLGTVAIIGVGLIGGSVGRALRERGLARRVVGIGRNPQSLDDAVRLGAIDDGTIQAAAGLEGAELAVVCTPVSRIAEDVLEAARLGPRHLLITDVGSTKRRIVEAVAADRKERSAFVPAHPIAGSEKSGVAHARGDLFEGRPCVITPAAWCPEPHVERIRDFWSAIGCRVVTMTPEAHDEALAMTSHLPHALAAALASSTPEPWLPLAGGAYLDATRVAAANSDLWAEIFRENREPVLQALNALRVQLGRFREALAAEDPSVLRAWWDQGRDRRSRLNHTANAEAQ